MQKDVYATILIFIMVKINRRDISKTQCSQSVAVQTPIFFDEVKNIENACAGAFFSMTNTFYILRPLIKQSTVFLQIIIFRMVGMITKQILVRLR